jgi:hypothetical protein
MLQKPIEKITIKRAEGLIKSCEGVHTVYTYAQASAVLRGMAIMYPPSISDKVDFTILWQDGEQWGGTYLLRKIGEDPYAFSLADHVQWFITNYLNRDEALRNPEDSAFMQMILTGGYLVEAASDVREA